MENSWRNQYSKYKDFFLTAYQSYTKKEEVKMYLEILLSLFTSSMFIIFALRPTLLTIIDLNKTITAKQKTVAQMDQKISDLQKAKDIYNSEKSQLELTLNSVPEEPEPDTLSVQLNALAQQDGVTLSGMSADPTKIVGATNIDSTQSVNTTIENIEPLPDKVPGASFAVNVTGSFNSLLTYLSDIKNLRRVIRIDSVKMASVNNGTTSSLTLAIIGRVTYLSSK